MTWRGPLDRDARECRRSLLRSRSTGAGPLAPPKARRSGAGRWLAIVVLLAASRASADEALYLGWSSCPAALTVTSNAVST
jgi:hypothetical protein